MEKGHTCFPLLRSKTTKEGASFVVDGEEGNEAADGGRRTEGKTESSCSSAGGGQRETRQRRGAVGRKQGDDGGGVGEQGCGGKGEGKQGGRGMGREGASKSAGVRRVRTEENDEDRGFGRQNDEV